MSCYNRFASQKIVVKIIEIPDNIQSKQIIKKLNKSLINYTLEQLHCEKSSLLDELYYENGYLILSLKDGIRFHNGYPLSANHLIPFLEEQNLTNYEIVSDLSIKIKYLEENKNQVNNLFHSKIKFYPEATAEKLQNFFVGTGEFYLNDFDDSQIILKTFNAHPRFKIRNNKTLVFTWDKNVSADLIIPFSEINKLDNKNLILGQF